MDFIELARSRYSCKSFDSRQISKEQLDSILEAGRLAPTAKNLQEQHVYVVQSAEGLAKVDALTPGRYGAPTMLIVAFDKNNVLARCERINLGQSFCRLHHIDMLLLQVLCRRSPASCLQDAAELFFTDLTRVKTLAGIPASC